MNRDEMIRLEAYGLERAEKSTFLSDTLISLSKYHADHCPAYNRILQAYRIDLDALTSYEQLPPLPVRLFKEYDLKSVPDEELFRTMTSSGTTGQEVSRIYLDRETAVLQSKVLAKIMENALGKQRLPMIVVDSSAVMKNRAMFSARGAGIRGFSMFGRDVIYALDENMKLDIEGLQAFLRKHENKSIFLFGFTSIIWQHFYQELKKTGISLQIRDGVMVHGGGWKKLKDQAVDKGTFKQSIQSVCGAIRVFDYYGMVEQTGTIYMECEYGHLHTSVWSDVLIRNPKDFSLAGMHETGLIEVVSVLPGSYPGHVLLTEDQGRILGEDRCPCGRQGKYFEVLGRIERAEVRGCSDTYEQA